MQMEEMFLFIYLSIKTPPNNFSDWGQVKSNTPLNRYESHTLLRNNNSIFAYTSQHSIEYSIHWDVVIPQHAYYTYSVL